MKRLLFLTVACLVAPLVSFADVGQTDHSVGINTNTSPLNAVQTLGTGLNSTVSEVDLWGTGNYILQWFDQCDDASMQTNCTATAQQGGYIGSYYNALIPISITPFTFDPTKYYDLRFTVWDFIYGTSIAKGSSTDTYTNGTANPSPCPAGLSGYCTSRSVSDWYFNIIGATSGPLVVPDGVATVTSPIGTTASTTVEFSGTFNNGNSHTYDVMSLYQTVFLTPTDNHTLAISSSWLANVAASSTSIGNSIPFKFKAVEPYAGHYFFTLDLVDSVTLEKTTSTIYDFTIATSTSFYSPPDVGCATASALDLFCDLKLGMVWGLYPSEGLIDQVTSLLDVLQTKPPIGYFSIAKNALQGLNASSTPTVTVTIPTTLKTYIFHPIDLGIASIFWFFVLINFFKRVTTILI